MRNAHLRFACFPSVVCVDKETEISIVPLDTNQFFREDREYNLLVLGLGEDQDNFDSPIPFDYPCRVEDGCLRFTYFFDMEQEYSIRFCSPGKPEIRLSLYAVEEDLYALRPLKGDLHSHSSFSDGSDGAAMTPADYREDGFDFFSLTDHNRMYPSKLAAELYQDIPLGIHMIPGEEVHTPNSLLHIVHVGGTESVCNQYIHDREAYESAVDALTETLTHIPEQYRRRMAMAIWACDKIHKAGGLAIFAHPFWVPRRYNLTREFIDLLFQAKIFDAFELMAGLSDRENNMQLALWMEQLMVGNYLPVVGSSDSHFHDHANDRDFGKRFTVVFARDNSTEAIMEAIRSDYSVAGELSPNNDSDVRFYSRHLRLVQFSHFLHTHYFTETKRLCFGESILMRRYAQGEDVGTQLAGIADTVESFYKRFYGITPAPGIPRERLAYLKKSLDIHYEEGPATRGSQIYILPDGRNKRNF